jgi:hypothetical protein
MYIKATRLNKNKGSRKAIDFWFPQDMLPSNTVSPRLRIFTTKNIGNKMKIFNPSFDRWYKEDEDCKSIGGLWSPIELRGFAVCERGQPPPYNQWSLNEVCFEAKRMFLEFMQQHWTPIGEALCRILQQAAKQIFDDFKIESFPEFTFNVYDSKNRHNGREPKFFGFLEIKLMERNYDGTIKPLSFGTLSNKHYTNIFFKMYSRSMLYGAIPNFQARPYHSEQYRKKENTKKSEKRLQQNKVDRLIKNNR